MVWSPEAFDGMVTSTSTAPAAFAVVCARTVGEEYITAVTPESAPKPLTGQGHNPTRSLASRHERQRRHRPAVACPEG